MSTKHPHDIKPGDPWTLITRNGDARHYEVKNIEGGREFANEPKYSVHLTCLDPPYPPVEGYKGGASREARVYIGTLTNDRDGWVAGHVDRATFAAA